MKGETELQIFDKANEDYTTVSGKRRIHRAAKDVSELFWGLTKPLFFAIIRT